MSSDTHISQLLQMISARNMLIIKFYLATTILMIPLPLFHLHSRQTQTPLFPIDKHYSIQNL